MISRIQHLAFLCLLVIPLFSVGVAHANETSPKVMIKENLPYVEVDHHGIKVKVTRIQDTENRLIDDFSKTSRPCPPFCIHPIQAAPDIKTFGEIELLEFLQNNATSKKGLLIDARMPEWYESETIPGSVNIPFVIFTKLSTKRGRVLELLGAVKDESGNFDFTNAKNLCLFCNGPWCDQSPRAIQGLINAGYPPEKLAYYRGGMQLWKLFGLTTVLPKSHAVE